MQSQSADIVVIGGGVAGLAAAGELARRGARVILLEARRRLGGRVFTERRRGWPVPIELGAQFVHGGNDALWALLRRHRIATDLVPGRHWNYRDQGFVEIDATKRIADVTGEIDEKKMHGWSFAKFMRRHGRRFDPIDRDLALGFVEGFEAAPTTEMSAIAVAGETLEDDEQYVVRGGYDQVVDALVRELDGVRVFLDAPVRRAAWRAGHVEVMTAGARFEGVGAIVTLPLGVLQAAAGARGAVEFSPSLSAQARIAARMGVGHVIRLTVRFDGRAWRRLLPDALRVAARRGLGFVHSRLEGVPVWWSLNASPVATGWAGGPNATALAPKSECSIAHAALRSLALLFGRTVEQVQGAIVDVATHNWSRDPYSRGAYSFTRAGQDDAAEKLRAPLRQTLFFAGEATANGAEVGTVHGAVASGLRAAQEVARVLL